MRISTPFHRFNSSQISEGHEVNTSQEFYILLAKVEGICDGQVCLSA